MGRRLQHSCDPLAAGVLAAHGILLAPAFAAVLMSASTVIVAINAQLMRRTRLEARASVPLAVHGVTVPAFAIMVVTCG